MNYTKPLTFLTLLFSLAIFSQTSGSEDDKLSLNSGTIDNQFDYVITKSNGWRDERGQSYRVIKAHWLTDLKAHTLDSLQAIRKNLVATEITVKAQTQEIADLKTSLSNTQNNLDKTKSEKNSISLFGTQMSKSGYSGLMWSIIAILLAFLIFFIYKFKNSNAVTKEAKRTLSDVEDEFEEHRKIAVEREQKVRRQLQDEINKQKIIKAKK
ncbi:tRNA (guanine-N1)-methyltransferase [Mariniflexile litorale]|uniref:tRNA (Guanine-N1)-methyltransferase n=1 Tax=Mariniflexile litorale TaxID=3045158 RepID=A0AAU7EGW1_9FLAO|nr:tRNA (guanine-N1)-methyltransferase [Mariniflexile sp. KMM 9835]MDQ8211711.1 tRNA (guanine-N1)-methyltransferase [Mariniflexile sp. KMM 9835]